MLEYLTTYALDTLTASFVGAISDAFARITDAAFLRALISLLNYNRYTPTNATLFIVVFQFARQVLASGSPWFSHKLKQIPCIGLPTHAINAVHLTSNRR